MRLFLLGWSVDLGLTQVVRELKAQGHKISYWVVADAERLRDLARDFPETVFHDHYEALAGKPAKQWVHTLFPPVGRKHIRELCDIESMTLSMMSKRYEGVGVEERRHVYYEMLRYWEGIVEVYRPEVMIFPAMPHSVYDYILYELAKRKNIATILFECSVIGDRMLVYEDFKIGHPKLLRDVWRKEQGKAGLSDLSADVRKYYEKQAAQRWSQTIPDFRKTTYPAVEILLLGRYSKAQIRKRRLRAVFRSIKDLSFLKLVVRFFVNQVGPSMKKEYTSVESKANVERNFIYVPLHYQPEQSTITQGDVFVDQRLLIEILSAALPEGWLIYVKEHPYQWLARGTSFFSLRPRGYYISLAKLQNVRIIPAETNTYQLIRTARAVATVSGTAALEAIMQQKPALLFGYAWFQNGPGIFKVEDVKTCADALKIIASGYGVSTDELIAFLAVFDKVSFRGYLDPEWREASNLSLKDNIQNVERALQDMLEKQVH